MYKNHNTSYMLQVGKVQPKYKYEINKATKRIHGLKFKDNFGDFPQHCLMNILGELYEECKYHGYYQIGYVGSRFTKQILNSLRIHSVCLKHLDCPRFKEIEDEYSDKNHDCNQHNHAEKHVRCSRQIVHSYKMWYVHNKLY